ncbi:MAG: hypothetical protein JJU02_05745 [Cryomorphaceae bacterium]|nr:hypothetical protein [Cryomorphaceae bacterium]
MESNKISLTLQVIAVTVISGGLLMVVLCFGGGDPAIAAIPAITMVADTTRRLIYFGMATLFSHFKFQLN